MARRSEITREEIRELAINKALKLLVAHGDKAFNARTIAREMGYSVGTLYYEFGSMVQFRYHLCGRILDIFMQTLKDDLSPRQRSIQKIMMEYIKLSRTHEHLWTFLFTFKAGLREETPQWYRAKIAQVFKLIEDSLAPYKLTPKQTKESARIIWSSIHGMCVLDLSGKLQIVDADTPEKMSAKFLRTYLKSLGNK